MMGYEPAGRIRPVAPAPSILTSARPLPDGLDWRSGIAWESGCQLTYNVEDCPPDVLTEDPLYNTLYSRGEGEGDEYEMAGAAAIYKRLPESTQVIHTVPFTFYTPFRCEMPVMENEAESGAVEDTTVHTAAAIASALWMGDGLDSDDLTIPTLRRSAWDVSGGSPYDLDDGVQALLTHYSQATGGEGGAVIHMPAGLVVGALGGVSGGGRVCWPEGNLYRAAMGAIVSPGPGYPEGFSVTGPDGHGPLIDAGPPESYAGNESGTAWVYVTGPVEYAVSDVVLWPPERRDRTVFRQNIYGLYAERRGIVRFDPCTTFAVEVWNPSPLPEVS